MITKHEKSKEFFEYIIRNTNPECLQYKNGHFDTSGVAYVMTYEYTTKYEYKINNKKSSMDNVFIRYSKWFVEYYDYVKALNLPGCEKHDKLVKGGGVYVHSDKHGDFTFYGKQAQDLINACEQAR